MFANAANPQPKVVFDLDTGELYAVAYLLIWMFCCAFSSSVKVFSIVREPIALTPNCTSANNEVLKSKINAKEKTFLNLKK